MPLSGWLVSTHCYDQICFWGKALLPQMLLLNESRFTNPTHLCTSPSSLPAYTYSQQKTSHMRS
jgi:hypothetical protein